MALKAGRVGVAPSEVDEFGQIVGEITPTNVYTKTEADNKFATKSNVERLDKYKYHGSSDGVKTITGANAYQQYLMTVFKGAVRMVVLLTISNAANTVFVENIYTTPGQTPIDFSVAYVADKKFSITVPALTQINMYSTEVFTVS